MSIQTKFTLFDVNANCKLKSLFFISNVLLSTVLSFYTLKWKRDKKQSSSRSVRNEISNFFKPTRKKFSVLIVIICFTFRFITISFFFAGLFWILVFVSFWEINLKYLTFDLVVMLFFIFSYMTLSVSELLFMSRLQITGAYVLIISNLIWYLKVACPAAEFYSSVVSSHL